MWGGGGWGLGQRGGERGGSGAAAGAPDVTFNIASGKRRARCVPSALMCVVQEPQGSALLMNRKSNLMRFLLK